MRVVIDTNVFVSGIFWSGAPAKVLKAWRDRQIEIVLTPAILDEYQRVGLELMRQFPSIDLSKIIEMMATSVLMVSDTALPTPVCSDPDDDKFLAAAITGGAEFVITGDKALLKIQEYGKVQITSPGTFVRNYLHKKKG
jgi:uncharacterized protein